MARFPTVTGMLKPLSPTVRRHPTLGFPFYCLKHESRWPLSSSRDKKPFPEGCITLTHSGSSKSVFIDRAHLKKESFSLCLNSVS